MMDAKTIGLVQESWRAVEPIAPQAAELFYGNLFEADPALKPLFKGDMKQQGDKLMKMISAAVKGLNDVPALVPVLQGLGVRHLGYGVVPAHYDVVGAALLKTLGQGLGEAFTPEVRAAWTSVYTTMAGVMIEAATKAKAAT